MTLSLYLRLQIKTLTNEYLHMSKLSTLQQAHCFASLLRTKHELELGKKHFPFRTHQKQNLAEQIHIFRAYQELKLADEKSPKHFHNIFALVFAYAKYTFLML